MNYSDRVPTFDMGDTLVASQYLLDRHFKSLLGEDFEKTFSEGYPQTEYNIWREEDQRDLIHDKDLDVEALDFESLIDDLTGLDSRYERNIQSVDNVQDAAETIVSTYIDREEHFMEETGVFDTLDFLKEQYGTVAVLTNNSYEGGEIYKNIFDRNLEEGLDVLISSEHPNVNASKPAWKPYDILCRKLDEDPENVVYFGNKEIGDVYAAGEAGLPAVGVLFYQNTLSDNKDYMTLGSEMSENEIENVLNSDRRVWDKEEVVSVVEEAIPVRRKSSN